LGQRCLGHHAFLDADTKLALVQLLETVDIFPGFLINGFPYDFVLLAELLLLVLQLAALLLLILNFLGVLSLGVFKFAVLEQLQL
jgi:hypothetical protein